MQLTFDPQKDATNILKHGLSLADAPLVFNAPNKLTLSSLKGEEARFRDPINLVCARSLGWNQAMR